VVRFLRIVGKQHDIACLRAPKRVSLDFRRRPFAAFLYIVDFCGETVCCGEPDDLQGG